MWRPKGGATCSPRTLLLGPSGNIGKRCKLRGLPARNYELRRRRPITPTITPEPSKSAPATGAMRAGPPVLGGTPPAVVALSSSSSSAPAVAVPVAVGVAVAAGLAVAVAVAIAVAVAASSSSSSWAMAAGAKSTSVSKATIARSRVLLFIEYLVSLVYRGLRSLHLLTDNVT